MSAQRYESYSSLGVFVPALVHDDSYCTIEKTKQCTKKASSLYPSTVGSYSHIPNRHTYTFIYFPKICSPIRHYSGLYVYLICSQSTHFYLVHVY